LIAASFAFFKQTGLRVACFHYARKFCWGSLRLKVYVKQTQKLQNRFV